MYTLTVFLAGFCGALVAGRFVSGVEKEAAHILQGSGHLTAVGSMARLVGVAIALALPALLHPRAVVVSVLVFAASRNLALLQHAGIVPSWNELVRRLGRLRSRRCQMSASTPGV
ncbi:MAG: hypothetical protein MJD61_05035 [Proteobacteria bacterium]|nr:hypothetical protein [Pseudomonadota bacterium]